MEIRGPGDVNRPQRPQGPEKAQETSGADKAKFQESIKPQSTAGASKPAGPAMAQPNFDRMASRIRQGLAGNQPRQQIIEGIVDDELKAQFGNNTTAEMRDAVADRLQNDPNLSRIVNRLFQQAQSQPAG